MIIPNIERVLIQRVQRDKDQSSGLIMPGQLKAGENLFYGEIIHPGTTKFQKGQRVYYSEYSAAAVYDYGAFARGEKTASEAMGTSQEQFFIVAEDDIMAYEDMPEVVKTKK